MQVVTNENLVEFHQKGSVAEFKPPEAPKTDSQVKTDDKPNAEKSAETKVEAKVEKQEQKSEPQRGEDGKFKKADEGATSTTADDDDPVLTEKIRKIVAKKHREMREAQEFATGEGRRAIAAERRAAELQAEIDALKGKSKGPESGEGAKGDPDEPQPGDFKTVGEYTRALIKYEAKKAGEAGKAQAEATRQQGEANKVIASFVERQEAFKKATPDYEETLEAADFEVPPIAQQYLVESELGPQLAYHIAKNPDVITRLKTLSPSRQLAELGKLEAKLEKPVDAPNKAAAGSASNVSKAPAPISPIEGKSTPVVKDPATMSFSELREHRRQEALAQARAGR